MNRYYIFGMLLLIFIAGCIQTTAPPTEEKPPTTITPPIKECRTLPTEEPYIEEECINVTYVEEECILKELEYTVSPVTKIDLCTSGTCTGKPISECFYSCTSAMTRCQMNITNKDEKHSGTWVVGANFGYMSASFVKNPQTAEIPPGGTHTFDFEQMYNMGELPTIASCTLTVLYPAIVRDCVQVEKTRVDCKNVSKVRIVQREVCD